MSFPTSSTLIPYAVHETLERLWPWLRAWIAARVPRFHPTQVAVTLLALFFAARFALAAPTAFAKSPRDLYEVPPRWHETSLWLSQNLGRASASRCPTRATTRTGTCPFRTPTRAGRSGTEAPRRRCSEFMRQEHVRKVMIDRESAGFAEDRQKLSVDADAHGSLAFLDWPRCFADSATPSRFLIYCQPSLDR